MAAVANSSGWPVGDQNIQPGGNGCPIGLQFISRAHVGPIVKSGSEWRAKQRQPCPGCLRVNQEVDLGVAFGVD